MLSLLLGSCATTPTHRLSIPVGSASGSAQPDAAIAQDYSPSAIFHEAHGDFLARRNRFRPAFRGSFLAMPNASLNNDPGDFDVTQFKAEGGAPFVVDPDSVGTIGGLVKARRYEFSSNTPGLEDETVWGLGMTFGFGRFVNDETLVELEFAPGVYSDLDGSLHHNDWQFFGKGLVTFHHSDELYLKGGVEVTEVFDDVPVYPLLGLSWLFQPGMATRPTCAARNRVVVFTRHGWQHILVCRTQPRR